jgi:hypothetical protein
MTRDEAIAIADPIAAGTAPFGGAEWGWRFVSAELVGDGDFSERVRAPYWYVWYEQVYREPDGSVVAYGRSPLGVAIDTATGITKTAFVL